MLYYCSCNLFFLPCEWIILANNHVVSIDQLMQTYDDSTHLNFHTFDTDGFCVWLTSRVKGIIDYCKRGVTEEGEAVWCFEANKVRLQSKYNKMPLIDFRSKSSSFQ